MKKSIAKINDTEIFAESNEDGIFVPIKPICTALGISFQGQRDKIQEDEKLSSVVRLSLTTGADGKQYDMVTLPLKYIYGWLFTINPKNVAPEAKEAVLKYRDECYDVLYDHFTETTNKIIKSNNEEIEILKKINSILEQKKELNSQIKEMDAQVKEMNKKLEEIRADRINPQPSLFD